MKKIVLFAFFICVTVLANAQAFQKGTSVLSFDIGLGSSLGYFGGGTQTPGLSVNFEKGIWELGPNGVVSLGAYVGYKQFSYSGSGYKWSWNYTIVGARSAYHYTGIKNDKVD